MKLHNFSVFLKRNGNMKRVASIAFPYIRIVASSSSLDLQA